MDAFIIVLIVLAAYFIPAFVAMLRALPNRGAIFLLNLLLGWTLLGWVAALVWSATAKTHVLEGSEVPTPDTHVRCPDCKELVRRDASKCKHCGTRLVPQ